MGDIRTTTPRHQISAPGPILSPTIAGYILRQSGRHQIGLAALSVIVFLLSTVPLELQRRIVNDAVYQGKVTPIIWLALGYAGVALVEGGVKLAMNIYRGWVGETVVRHLRNSVRAATQSIPSRHDSDVEGIEASLILSEVEPIGGFIGISASEPLLQGGILLSVFAYMVYLQPEIALVCLLVFSPQLFFVPLMQGAINRRAAFRIRILRDVSGGIIDVAHHHRDQGMVQAKRIDRVFALNMGIYKLKFTMNFLMNLMNHLGVAAVLAVGGWFAVTGRIEVGTVVAFVSGLAKVNDPWGDIVNWFRDATSNGIKYRLIAEAVARFQRRPEITPEDPGAR